jgi:hypothetical protein
MKGAEYFVSCYITDEYNVTVNSEELIGTPRISDVIEQVTYKPMSL